jgi:ribose transport system ATP-binding protein
MGETIDPRARLGDLSTGYWQLTEIAKALAQNSRVLIMDEPTASLTGTETRSLFELVRKLKAQGISIIYISHRMEEIFELTDRITVLRDGRLIVTEQTSNLTMPRLIDHIVGQTMEQAFEWQERTVDRTGEPLLSVQGISAGHRVRSVSFDLYRGEILGIAGPDGQRSDRTRAGSLRDRSDRVRHDQGPRAPRLDHRPEDAIAAGISLVPEDRRLQGLVLDHSVKNNLLLPLLRRIRRGGVIDDARGDELTRAYVKSLSIKTDSIDKTVRLLSGGNQQKVVIGKWLATEPDILLMDEPTAGVDIQAKTEILAVIRRLADSGKGVIVISSELVELLAVSDRLLIMQGGSLRRELGRREIATEEELHHAVQSAA